MKVSPAEINRLMLDYQEAYAAANDKPCPRLVWDSGWFVIGESGRTKYRRARLKEMLANLRWRAWNERSIALPSEERSC